MTNQVRSNYRQQLAQFEREAERAANAMVTKVAVGIRTINVRQLRTKREDYEGNQIKKNAASTIKRKKAKGIKPIQPLVGEHKILSSSQSYEIVRDKRALSATVTPRVRSYPGKRAVALVQVIEYVRAKGYNWWGIPRKLKEFGDLVKRAQLDAVREINRNLRRLWG